MLDQPPQSRVQEVVAALRDCDRERAVLLLRDELENEPSWGNRWNTIAHLAGRIGEVDIAIEAARRYSQTEPITLDRLLRYWGTLARNDRTDDARSEVGKLPAHLQRQTAVLHFLGTLAGQEGDFAAAEQFFREAIARSPHVAETWFALATIKRFVPSDPDLAAMEDLRPAMARTEPAIYAPFLYGLAKAWHDCGDYDRAFALYSEGAALRRQQEEWDLESFERFVNGLIGDFTPEAMVQLAPSGEARPVLFVDGLPRSGTTLVEQILVSHPRVAEGSEVNLLRAALLPTGDHSLAGALRFQQKSAGSGDPWGAVAASYFRMLEMRFRTSKLVVDKTLGHSHFMGLLLHMLPSARIVWMRRDPADAAISCFRTYFTEGMPWSWSLADIGHYFRLEDRLHAHWTAMFPDRILTVDYEALVTDAKVWIPRIASHCGLELAPPMFEAYKTKRGVLTASMQQVRAPITTDRIGLSTAYSAHLEPFRIAYFG